MLKMTRIMALALVLVSVFVFTACSQPSTSPSASAAASTAKASEPAKASDTPAVDEPEPAKSYDKNLTISMTVLDAEKTGNTDRDKWFNEKFNVTWEYIPVTWGDWFEKVRAMVAGDNMPDILWWDMKVNHTSEFRGWAQQGAFRDISDLSQWPNIDALRDTLQSDDKMLTVDGKLYGWPVSRSNPEWLQNAYYPLYAYRRDWAKAVGMYKEGDQYTYEEIFAMIDAVKEQDPGGNGPGNTFGITSETWAFAGVFMEILGYGKDRSGYIKTGEGHVPYFTTEAWRNELKFVTDMYRNGYIWKDQMVVGGSEGQDNFKAGRTFMFLGNNSPSWFAGIYQTMLDSGVIKSVDDVGPMIAFSPADGKTFTLTQTEDYWTVVNFPYSLDDEKFERIMDMWSWLWTEDGRAFRVAGIEGKDYERISDTEIKILWDKTADGVWNTPYKDTGSNMYTPPAGVPAPNEASNMMGFDAFNIAGGVHDFIKTSPDYYVNPLNWDLNTFNGEQYSQFGAFSSDVTAKIKEIMASSEDVDKLVDAWLKEMEPKWKPVAAELDEAFGK